MTSIGEEKSAVFLVTGRSSITGEGCFAILQYVEEPVGGKVPASEGSSLIVTVPRPVQDPKWSLKYFSQELDGGNGIEIARSPDPAQFLLAIRMLKPPTCFRSIVVCKDPFCPQKTQSYCVLFAHNSRYMDLYRDLINRVATGKGLPPEPGVAAILAGNYQTCGQFCSMQILFDSEPSFHFMQALDVVSSEHGKLPAELAPKLFKTTNADSCRPQPSKGQAKCFHGADLFTIALLKVAKDMDLLRTAAENASWVFQKYSSQNRVQGRAVIRPKVTKQLLPSFIGFFESLERFCSSNVSSKWNSIRARRRMAADKTSKDKETHRLSRKLTSLDAAMEHWKLLIYICARKSNLTKGIDSITILRNGRIRVYFDCLKISSTFVRRLL